MNTMDLFDQHDSKGQMQLISLRSDSDRSLSEGLPIYHNTQLARNVLNQQKKFPAYLVAPSNDRVRQTWNILGKYIVPLMPVC